MKHLTFIAAITLGFASLSLSAQAKDVKVSSPNGKITVNISDKGGSLSYSAALNGKTIFNQSALEVILENKTLGKKAGISGVTKKDVRTSFKPVVAFRQGTIKNNYTDAMLTMKGNYKVEFRIFDNAVAYRFIINESSDSVNVVNETLNIKPVEEMTVHYQPSSYEWITSAELPYVHCPLSEWKNDQKLATLPLVLSSTTDDVNLLISESDVTDYSGMFLRGTGEKDQLECHLIPYFKNWELSGDRSTKINELASYAARIAGKRTLPWRYVVITDAKGILEQTLTAQLAAPCELKDVSWIKPGQVSWDWWNHKSIYGPDVHFVTGCNTATYKYFIDFASKYGIPYIIMDEGWAENTFTPFQANKDLDLKECIRYGKEKGVGIILWLTWSCVERNLKTIFKTYEEWGIAGCKIDFMDRQDQWMQRWYERTIKEAAKYHMIVDFHGAMKPTGLEYRYPNLMAYEAVRGLENMDGCTPENTLYIPFLRNAVGPADFTPGAMINVQPEYDKWASPNCTGEGTRAYNMALFTVLETGTQMLCDSPTQYYKNPECTKFLSEVPVTWDETRAIEAQLGQYLVLAKRHGQKWFVAGICNGKEETRNVKVPLNFLSAGTHKMTLITDGPNAGWQAMDYDMETRNVTSATTLDITMVKNGGFTAIIE